MTLRTATLAVAGALALGLAPAASAQSSESERTFKKLTLENGLRVVIASDPKVNVSAASIAVGIGANADPKGSAGLAHFLEHMLFLANKKYPKLNAYSEFLRSRGGMSNAYTAADHTNYHFQVNHDGFPEALDRFAQFFISPTLDWKYAQREMMAVNSEHQKNIMDDTWRLMQLQRAHVKAGHPAGGFSTGTKDTLANAKAEVLRGFFDDYYRPKNMTLAIISNRPLSELEALVKERFAAMEAKPAKAWTTNGDLLDAKKALRLLKVVPIKDLRQLKLYFEVPPQHAKALTKTESMVGMTMGDEGPGSLLSYLKSLGLATSLSGGIQSTRFYSACHVTIGLSEKGLAQWREVLKLAFAYTEMLRRSKFPKYLWEEMRTMAQLRKRYSAKPEGTDAVIQLANNVLDHGLEVAEKVDVTFKGPDPEGYKALVDAMRPENALVFLVSKGLKTDKTETHYGTNYSYTEETGKNFTELQEPTVPKGLFLPPPNPFVPKDVSLRAEQPVKLVANDGLTLWYAQDTEFKRPKVAIHLHLLTPAAAGSSENSAKTQLLAGVINEQLNELAYPAMLAGLTFSLAPTEKGLLVTVAGYSDSAFRLLDIMGKELRKPLSEKAFAAIKDKLTRSLKNFPLSQAYMVTTQMARKIVFKDYSMPSEINAALGAVDMTSLAAHREALLTQVHVQGMAVGNLTATQAKKAVADFRALIKSEPLPAASVANPAVVWLEPKDEIVIQQKAATNNACLRLDYQLGKSDLKTRLAAQILARGMQNAFYTEMRTKQKLGYIVFSGTYNRQNVQYQTFIIQSGTHDSADLRKRAEQFIAGFPAEFKQMPAAMFAAIRKSLIADRMKPAKTIASKAGRYFGAAFDKDEAFDYLEREIKALEQIKQADVQALLEAAVAPETRSRIVYQLNAKQQPDFKAPVTDLDALKKGRTFTNAKAGY